MTDLKTVVAELPAFDRHFWDGTLRFTRIGTGSLGGKASGLAFAKDMLAETADASAFPNIDVNVPTTKRQATAWSSLCGTASVQGFGNVSQYAIELYQRFGRATRPCPRACQL